MIVRANIRFGLHSSFLDRGFEAEDERLPGESIEDGVLRIEAALTRAENILKAKIESMRGQIITETIQGAKSEQWQVPVIAKEADPVAGLIADIYTCDNLKVLESYRLLAKKDKQLQAAYDQMFVKLSVV